jgi:hypothetical protein
MLFARRASRNPIPDYFLTTVPMISYGLEGLGVEARRGLV